MALYAVKNKRERGFVRVRDLVELKEATEAVLSGQTDVKPSEPCAPKDPCPTTDLTTVNKQLRKLNPQLWTPTTPGNNVAEDFGDGTYGMRVTGSFAFETNNIVNIVVNNINAPRDIIAVGGYVEVSGGSQSGEPHSGTSGANRKQKRAIGNSGAIDARFTVDTYVCPGCTTDGEKAGTYTEIRFQTTPEDGRWITGYDAWIIFKDL